MKNKLILVTILIISFFILLRMYSHESYVWNGNITNIDLIKPHLNRILLASIITFIPLEAVLMYVLYNGISKKLKIFAFIISCIAFLLAGKLVNYELSEDFYYVWKYQSKTEEFSDELPEEVNTKIIGLLLHDLRDPTQNLEIRSKVAFALASIRTDYSYSALRSVSGNKGENIYLRLSCLKAMRMINKRRFLIDFNSIKNDSLYYLYNKYQP